MATDTAQSYFNNLLSRSNTDLSVIQPYISVEYKNRNEDKKAWKFVAVSITQDGDDYFKSKINKPVMDIEEVIIERRDHTLRFADVSITYVIHQSYFDETDLINLSNPDNHYRLTFGINIDEVQYTESVTMGQLYSNIIIDHDYVKLEAHYNGDLKMYMDVNNTVSSGKDLQTLLSQVPPKFDIKCYYLEDILNAIQTHLKSVVNIKYDYVPLSDPIVISSRSNGQQITKLTELNKMPISYDRFNELLSKSVSFSKLLDSLKDLTYYVGQRLTLDYDDNDPSTIIVDLEENDIYDKKVEPFKISGMKKNNLLRFAFRNEINYASLNNDSVINTLTDEYLNGAGLEPYTFKTEIKDNVAINTIETALGKDINNRMLLSDMNSEYASLMKELAQQFYQSDSPEAVNQIKMTAKNVKMRPSLPWTQSYGSITVDTSFPLLYLRIADLVEISDVIQGVAFDKKLNSQTRFKGLYYINSIKHTFNKNTIQSAIDCSLVRFIV